MRGVSLAPSSSFEGGGLGRNGLDGEESFPSCPDLRRFSQDLFSVGSGGSAAGALRDQR